MKEIKKAFTLIELAIVAAIIGLLALIAIPSMQKGISRAYAKDVLQNLKALLAAEENYALEHDGAYFYCVAPLNPDDCLDDPGGLNETLKTNIIAKESFKYGAAQLIEPGFPNVVLIKASNVPSGGSPTSNQFTMLIKSRFAISQPATPVYCEVPGYPSVNYNPCCDKSGTTHTTGEICP